MGEPLLHVADGGAELRFGVEDLMRYHGGPSPGGVAHAFKVLERALPLLSPEGPAERRELRVRTAFGGPGARDGFELVTRAVTEDRYVVDEALVRPGLGFARERFVFALANREREVTLVVREGFVPEELLELARAGARTAEQERRLAALKQQMADRVLARPAAEIYDVDP